MLRQLFCDIKNQLKATKAPYEGLWSEMLPTWSISYHSLVLYGIRLGGFHARKESIIGPLIPRQLSTVERDNSRNGALPLFEFKKRNKSNFS